MPTFTHNGKSYEVDQRDFLLNPESWDENFSKGMAPQLNIVQGLTKEHWDVIFFIRNRFEETGQCPLVYETCQAMGFRHADLKNLFPTGYLRGACKLAGMTSKTGYIRITYHPERLEQTMSFLKSLSFQKTYTVNVTGFLVDPDDWDEQWAAYKAHEMKIPSGRLTEKHWELIYFLRESYQRNREVPTVYETCEKNNIELSELERLFPDGFHRGAVKIAGLRVS